MIGWLVAFGGSIVALVATWPTSKPFLQKKLAMLVEKLGPGFLGGAKVTLKQVLLGLGCDFTVGVDDLKIFNLEGWSTEYLLNLDDLYLTISLAGLSKSACQNGGSPSEIILKDVLIKGCSVSYEKSLMSSNVNAMLDAMNQQEAKEKQDFNLQSRLTSAMASAEDAANATVKAAGDQAGALTGNGRKEASKQKKATTLILHKVVIEDVSMTVTSSFSSSTVKVPAIVIEDFFAQYGPATPRALISMLLSTIFSEGAKAFGETITGLGSSAATVGTSVASAGGSVFGSVFGS